MRMWNYLINTCIALMQTIIYYNTAMILAKAMTDHIAKYFSCVFNGLKTRMQHSLRIAMEIHAFAKASTYLKSLYQASSLACYN